MSEAPRVEVLDRASRAALFDARAAWLRARDQPNADTVRAAFRQCVLAARLARQTADSDPETSGWWADNATRIATVAKQLRAQLVRIVEGPRSAAG